MQFPAYLPEELEELRSINDPTNLFYRLIQNPLRLAQFLQFAFDDDLWINRSHEFIKTTLNWTTQQYMQGRLEDEIAGTIANVVHKSYSRVRNLIPHNIKIVGTHEEYPANALLLGTTSFIFKDLIHEQLRGTNKSTLIVDEIPAKILKEFIEFSEEGTLENLWKQSSEEIIEMLEFSSKWHMEKLEQLSQESMQRYIDRDTVIPYLIRAYKDNWMILKNACIDFFNTLGYYLTLHKGNEREFIVEFDRFHILALEFYKQLAPYTTHLICRGQLSLDSHLVDVMLASPKMHMLDLSDSSEYSDYINEIPSKVTELILARCLWVDNNALGKVVRICPQLKKIDLTSVSQVDYQGWIELQHWKLNGLILNDCNRLQDNDLALILKSCNFLKELGLKGCRSLSDNALRFLGQRPLRFASLNLARTQLTDATFVEIVYGNRSLEEIDVTQCGISDDVIGKIKRDFPNLKISI